MLGWFGPVSATAALVKEATKNVAYAASSAGGVLGCAAKDVAKIADVEAVGAVGVTVTAAGGESGEATGALTKSIAESPGCAETAFSPEPAES